MGILNHFNDYLINLVGSLTTSNHWINVIGYIENIQYILDNKNSFTYEITRIFTHYAWVMDDIVSTSKFDNNDEVREVDQKILLKMKNILLYYIKNLIIETGLEIKSFEQLNLEAVTAAGQPWEIYELLMSAAEYCDYETCEKYCRIFADHEDDLVFGAILDVYKITSILNSKYDQDFADRLIAKGKLYSDDYIKSRAIILEEQINFWLKGGCQKVIDEALIEYKKNL